LIGWIHSLQVEIVPSRNFRDRDLLQIEIQDFIHAYLELENFELGIMKNLTTLSRLLIALSALLMISAYYVPLWQILMWAPQYPEGLEMKIWINTLSGDVKIISALNHYIGMKHIEVDMFPEFGYMIYIVGALLGVGLLTALINRRFMLVTYVTLIVAMGIAALVDFYMWGYDYGHNLDPTAPIVVPGMSYQPPLIGTKQLLNFTAFSGPDIGGWIFLVIGLLAIGVLIYEIKFVKKAV
jgi:copper chaperone NosL